MDLFHVYMLIGAGVIFTLVVGRLLKSRFKSPTREERAQIDEQARADFDSLPKCVCGELAVYPAPVLKRDRGAWDWLRSYFAAAPRYKRDVNMMLPPTFCEAHVHVADALMDQFIFRIRSEYSQLNARVAAEAASFEQESLGKFVSDSLTDIQKRNTRKGPGALRVLPVLTMKNGTDDGSDGQ